MFPEKADSRLKGGGRQQTNNMCRDDSDSARRSRCSKTGSAASTATRGSELKFTDATQARLAPCLRRKCLAPRARRRSLGDPAVCKAGGSLPVSSSRLAWAGEQPAPHRQHPGRRRRGGRRGHCRAEARADFGGPGGRDLCCGSRHF